MSPLQIAIIAIVVIALAVVIWLFLKAKRTKQLQSRFGPEFSAPFVHKELHAPQKKFYRKGSNVRPSGNHSIK